MMKFAKALAIGIALSSSAALAQTSAPKTPVPAAPTAAPTTATPAPAAKMEPAVEARFKASDKDGNGMLSGTELTAFTADLSKIDANKDGNVSRDEFASAVKSGVIK